MQLKRLYSLARKAIDDYAMIEDGDRIAVGISGGKDSLALLCALAGLKRFYPKKFELEAITVSLGFDGFDTSKIAALCDELGVHYTEVKTDIAEVVFDVRKETNPCSLCAKMRKGAFNDAAKSLGCNKSAYAHHRDDVIETALMSLIYEGHFYCFSPVTYLDRTDITLIRPLIYIDECDVIGFKKLYDLPVLKNPCPADGVTKREYVKGLVKQLEKENPGFRDRMFHAVTNGVLPAWVPVSDRK
ncbi:MAG: tRNA 2-thiocytidine(32) synthetase TtcA [Lachnospiraceae bacterium]|nr:tRNA 2-thiocytidine(32) synthetase TtcA [Lachnospiraceae bacterium]